MTISDLNASNITTGSLNANLLSIDGITLSRSGSNLIIKNGGVDTTQVALEAVNITEADTFSGFINSNQANNRNFPFYSTPTAGLPSIFITLTETTEVLVQWGVRFLGQASGAGNLIVRIYERLSSVSGGTIIEDIGSSPSAVSTGGFLGGSILRTKTAGTYQYYMNWAAFNSPLYEAYIIVQGIQR